MLWTFLQSFSFIPLMASEEKIFQYFSANLDFRLSWQPIKFNCLDKNAIFVEANVMNISAKFQLYPPYGFWGEHFSILFRKFSLSVVMATNQIQLFGQKWYVWYGLLNIFVKRLSKYLPFFIFPHYKSMATVSYHSNQSSYPIKIKRTTLFVPSPRPLDTICDFKF